MFKFLTSVVVSFLLFASLTAFAQGHTLRLTGTGIDGKTCRAKVVLNGDQISSIELKGAAKTWELVGENVGGHQPNSHVIARGGDEILNILQQSPELLAQMRKSQSWYSDTVAYTLNLQELVLKIELTYHGDLLTAVRATSKVKALGLAPLASATFECNKQ